MINIFFTTIAAIGILGGIVLTYLQIRLSKVNKLRRDMITFCSNLDDFEERFLWFENEVPSFEKMLHSLKPLDSFIVGTYSEQFKLFLKNKKNNK